MYLLHVFASSCLVSGASTAAQVHNAADLSVIPYNPRSVKSQHHAECLTAQVAWFPSALQCSGHHASSAHSGCWEKNLKSTMLGLPHGAQCTPATLCRLCVAQHMWFLKQIVADDSLETKARSADSLGACKHACVQAVTASDCRCGDLCIHA